MKEKTKTDVRRMTLDEIWSECLRMWRWIKLSEKDKGDVDYLKSLWLHKNGYNDLLGKYDCFFCYWAEKRDNFKICLKCPGRKIDLAFDCLNIEPNSDCLDLNISYWNDPKAFYRELKRLNKIRKK